MEQWVSQYAKISILNKNGLKRPTIEDVVVKDGSFDKIKFQGDIDDLDIIKCKCNDDEIIIETFHPRNKSQSGLIRVHAAHNAPHMLYKPLVKYAMGLQYPIEIKYCEDNSDLFYLDKMVQMHNETLETEEE